MSVSVYPQKVSEEKKKERSKSNQNSVLLIILQTFSSQWNQLHGTTLLEDCNVEYRL